MCGIAGQIARQGDIDRGRLEAACDLMVHRGPDDAGTWMDGGAGLAFRRLSIIDLSAAGHQPMLSPDGRTGIVFNGEIYNFGALRRELEQTFRFRSGTDTEVLLHGYEAWGFDELVRRIDGMFAFAIWDGRARVLRAARDRVGKKPFFFAESPDGFAFASTLNALRTLARLGDVDPAALDAYLTYQAVPAPLTMYAGARQLQPAHTLRYEPDTGRLDIRRYWQLAFSPKRRISEADALDEIDELVRQAVRRRLVSDVPLGAFLSGGVDSSLVVSMMAQESATPVEAVVMGFEDPAYDERPHARKVAQRWGVRLHEHVLEPDAVRDLPGIVWHYGQPLADVSIVPTYYVARAAREHVTVVLNGDGGDEAFGGYARPMVTRAAAMYRRLLPGGLRRAAGRALGPPNGHAGIGRWARMLTNAGAVEAADTFVYDRALRPHRREAYGEVLRLLDPSSADRLYRDAWFGSVAEDDVDRALYGDLSTYLPDQLLTKMDVSTMAYSVEGRSPLLDTALLEYSASLPTHLRLRRYTTKYLLKKVAERYVPREVLYRRKRGFVMPAGEWLRGELAPFAEAALTGRAFRERGWIEAAFVRRLLDEHRARTHDHGEALWTLFVLEIWARQSLDGTLGRNDALDALL